MIKAGLITVDQLRSCSPPKTLLLRVIGHEETVYVEQSDFQLEANDTILLCTAGLSCVLGDEEIAVNGPGDPTVACENLLKAAIEGGAPDNVSVIGAIVKCWAEFPGVPFSLV